MAPTRFPAWQLSGDRVFPSGHQNTPWNIHLVFIVRGALEVTADGRLIRHGKSGKLDYYRGLNNYLYYVGDPYSTGSIKYHNTLF